MVSRTRSEDSDPVLEVSAVGTGGPDGEYLQHEAVAPHKAHAVDMDPTTVVIRNESTPPAASGKNPEPSPEANKLHDEWSTTEDITSVTQARLRAKAWGLYRLVAFVEVHRLTTLTFVTGVLLLLVAGLLAMR